MHGKQGVPSPLARKRVEPGWRPVLLIVTPKAFQGVDVHVKFRSWTWL